MCAFHFDRRANGKGAFMKINIHKPAARLERTHEKWKVTGAVGNVVESIADKDHVYGSRGQVGIVGFCKHGLNICKMFRPGLLTKVVEHPVRDVHSVHLARRAYRPGRQHADSDQREQRGVIIE